MRRQDEGLLDIDDINAQVNLIIARMDAMEMVEGRQAESEDDDQTGQGLGEFLQEQILTLRLFWEPQLSFNLKLRLRRKTH